MGWLRQVGVDEEDRLTPRQASQVLRRAFRMLRPYRRSVLAGVVVMIGSTLSILAGPQLVKYGIDHGLSRHSGAAVYRAALGYPAVASGALVLSPAPIILTR